MPPKTKLQIESIWKYNCKGQQPHPFPFAATINRNCCFWNTIQTNFEYIKTSRFIFSLETYCACSISISQAVPTRHGATATYRGAEHAHSKQHGTKTNRQKKKQIRSINLYTYKIYRQIINKYIGDWQFNNIEGCGEREMICWGGGGDAEVCIVTVNSSNSSNTKSTTRRTRHVLFAYVFLCVCTFSNFFFSFLFFVARLNEIQIYWLKMQRDDSK